MGKWGIKAVESDIGLDLIHDLNEFLRNRYMKFNVREISEYLRKTEKEKLTASFMRIGDKSEEIERDVEWNIDFYYDHITLLVAELTSDFLQNGFIELDFYNKEIEDFQTFRITNVVYTKEDLMKLSEEINQFLQPDSDIYQSWFKDDLGRWIKHMSNILTSFEIEINRNFEPKM